MESWKIGNHILEFDYEDHLYICDGIVIPSITQILQTKFGNKYIGVSKEVLQQAADRGTMIHKAIEDFEKGETVEEIQEIKDYKFLKKHYNFQVINSEVPIILELNSIPVACGRLDQVLMINNQIGLSDIKTTATLDKEYLAYQLNLYRIGYRQTYGVEPEFLKAIHLKNGKRKFVDIPVNEDIAWQLINEYMEGKDE